MTKGVRPAFFLIVTSAFLWMAHLPFGLSATGQTGATTSGVTITVLVADRSNDLPIPSADVVVSQTGKAAHAGSAGANGTISFIGLTTGSVSILCEKNGYLMKPERSQTSLAKGDNRVRMTLLAPTQDSNYFRRAGQSIEAEAASLAPKDQEEFYRREWERIKQLRPEYQIPMVGEFKEGKKYLASEPQYQALLKSGKVMG